MSSLLDIGINDLGLGKHICSIYQNKEQQFSWLSSFIDETLKKNEKCVYVVDENSQEELLGELRKNCDDIDKFVESKQLEILTSEETYLKDGHFVMEKMLAIIDGVEKESLRSGYLGVRGIGEMSWMLNSLTDVAAVMEYESHLNDFVRGRKISLLCQYNENKFSREILNSVIQTHPQTIIYGKLYENKYFFTPSEYFRTNTNKLPAESYKTIVDTIVSE